MKTYKGLNVPEIPYTKTSLDRQYQMCDLAECEGKTLCDECIFDPSHIKAFEQWEKDN